MFSHGAGVDVMKRIAAPMVGVIVTSTILGLVIYPAIFQKSGHRSTAIFLSHRKPPVFDAK